MTETEQREAARRKLKRALKRAARRQRLRRAVPVVLQAGGAGIALLGVYLLWGFGLMLIVGGVGALAIGTLAEMRPVDGKGGSH